MKDVCEGEFKNIHPLSLSPFIPCRVKGGWSLYQLASSATGCIDDLTHQSTRGPTVSLASLFAHCFLLITPDQSPVIVWLPPKQPKNIKMSSFVQQNKALNQLASPLLLDTCTHIDPFYTFTMRGEEGRQKQLFRRDGSRTQCHNVNFIVLVFHLYIFYKVLFTAYSYL